MTVAHVIDGFELERVTGLTIGPRMCLDAGRRELVSPTVLAGRIAVIMGGGQSNCSNTAGGGYVPTGRELYNLNIGDGHLYRAEEPLLGCDIAKPGATSNFLTRLGDDILRAGFADCVVLVPWAISGVPAGMWSDRGRFHRNVTVTARRGLETALLPRSRCMCLWQHGETDGYLGTPGDEYTKDVINVAETIHRVLGPVPFITASATIHQGLMSPEIRRAQTAITKPAAGRFPGPDTDAVDGAGRHPVDCTHWNAEGSALVAELWLAALKPFLS